MRLSYINKPTVIVECSHCGDNSSDFKPIYLLFTIRLSIIGIRADKLSLKPDYLTQIPLFA